MIPYNHGKTWTKTEDDDLRKQFHSGMPLIEIAKTHGRKLAAIITRLERIGVIHTEFDRLTQEKVIFELVPHSRVSKGLLR